MKRLDYLKAVINHTVQEVITTKAWFVSAFAITKSKEKNINELKTYELVRESWGVSFKNTKGELEKIEDSKPNEPLFLFKEKITIDNSWLSNVKETIVTSIGNVLFNKLCILSSFDNKIDFVTGRISVEKIEDIIAPKLRDTPNRDEERSNNYFYVDEYIKFRDSLEFINTLSQLCTWSATPKNITPPKGIKEFKASLDKEYEGKLNNPIYLAEYEAKLKQFDADYLADDPSNDTFITSKIRNNSRKKLFLTVGGETGFEDNISFTTIKSSLTEGWPTDPKEFTAMMNNLRSGSFARGAETVKGGVAAKVLLRAANNYKIVDDDCGTKLGIRRKYNKKNIHYLVGRKIFLGNNTILINSIEEAEKYMGKDLVVRSPMFCKSPKETICINCASNALSQYKTGIAIPLTEISAIILATSMSKMHSTVLSLAELELDTGFS